MHLPFASLAAACAVSAAAIAPARAEPLADCIEAFRAERPPEVRAETFDRWTAQATDLRPTIEAATASQPEFVIPVWDYLARLVDAERVADGRAVLETQAAVLGPIAERHGVDGATAVAVFGVETDYGRVAGRYPVVDATLSRACLDRGSADRKRQLFAALWLLQEGMVAPERFRGSWAGAFGLTQFLPATFVAHRADGDGSGDVDILGSVPDALATTARFLAGLGWRRGLPWGVEVRRPAGSAALAASERAHACLAGAAGPGQRCRSVQAWAAAGVVPLRAGEAARLPPDTRAALLAPAGEGGPAWLVTPNYQAIWGYNRADSYALAIGLLSDALRGEPPPATAWPTDDAALSRAGVRQLQRDLQRVGHPEVQADGADGPLTRAAIRAEEQACGWPGTGRAGAKIAAAVASAAEGAASGAMTAASAPERAASAAPAARCRP